MLAKKHRTLWFWLALTLLVGTLGTSDLDAACSSATGCLDCAWVPDLSGYDCRRVKLSAYCACSDNNHGSCIAGGGSCDYIGPSCDKKPFCPDIPAGIDKNPTLATESTLTQPVQSNHQASDSGSAPRP